MQEMNNSRLYTMGASFPILKLKAAAPHRACLVPNTWTELSSQGATSKLSVAKSVFSLCVTSTRMVSGRAADTNTIVLRKQRHLIVPPGTNSRLPHAFLQPFNTAETPPLQPPLTPATPTILSPPNKPPPSPARSHHCSCRIPHNPGTASWYQSSCSSRSPCLPSSG